MFKTKIHREYHNLHFYEQSLLSRHNAYVFIHFKRNRATIAKMLYSEKVLRLSHIFSDREVRLCSFASQRQ